MKKLFSLVIVMTFLFCTSTKSIVETELYEILNYNNDGGDVIKFYEIITEPKEIQLLLSDPNLKRKIKASDIQTCNFIILNMGPMPEGNYNITIDKIEETDSAIIVYVKETIPQSVENNPSNQTDFIYPYSVIKIKSKKPIVIK